MDTAASLAAGLTTTPPRGWMVVLLSRLQGSSVVLISYSFGIFLPFIREDLHLSPLEAGLLQSAWWVTSAVLALPCSVWFSRFRPVPLVLVSLWLGLPFLVLQGLATHFLVLLLARFVFVLCHVISTRPGLCSSSNGQPRRSMPYSTRWASRSIACSWLSPLARARGSSRRQAAGVWSTGC